VPVGVLLSGGVDSSLVALSAARIGWRPETFTIGFEDESYDESRFAAETARELGLNNYQMHMSAESWESVQDILKLLDEPLGDSSFLPTYSVFKLASSKSKVLLSGDGGDELFFGYEPFRILQLSNVIQRVIPALARRLTSSFLSFLPRTSSYMNRIDIAERLLDGVSYSGVNRVLVWMATLRVREWKRFFPKSGSPEAMFEFSDSLSEIEDFGEAVRRLFLLSYLPGNVLMKSDRASMSNSVEARTIFFHPEIVNFALTQTLGQEMRGGKGKQSLRRIARESGLTKVAARKKHGFALPVAEVLRNPKITAPQIDLPGIEQREVDQEWLKLQAGRPARVQFLWAALSLVNSRAYRLVKHFEGSSAGGH
jgi:asparagine synthase (glutamine-hydrolysing)